MTAREIITLAQAGELLQLSPSIRDNDSIVVTFINLALIEIYKRFVLRTDEAMLTLKDGKTVYRLDGTDTDTVLVNNIPIPCVSMGTGKYMHMIAAYGPGLNEGDYTAHDIILPINEEDNPLSINTISYNEVQVPLITESSQISIIYASFPNKVDTTVIGWENLEVDVPDQFIESLLHYSGYRGHGSMNGDIQTDSNTHYMRFEASCNKLRELGVGITPDDIEMNTRIYDRNFA